ARGDDDVLRLERALARLHLARRGNAAFALHPLDLVLLEEELDALGVAVDGLVLEGEHLFQVELRLRHLDSHTLEALARLMEEFGGMEQRLRGNAADIEAGAAEPVALFHHRDIEPELRR